MAKPRIEESRRLKYQQTYAQGRRCKCGTILSIYNPDTICNACYNKLPPEQKDTVLIRGKALKGGMR